MYLTTLAAESAVGQILCHNLIGVDGRKAFAKGHRIKVADLPRLQTLGIGAVDVAVLEHDDVHEDEAARQLGNAVIGAGVTATAPAGSRVNILATTTGILQVDVEALLQINLIDGLTIATLPAKTLVQSRQRVATIKVIPFAVQGEALRTATTIGQTSGPVVAITPLRQLQVGVVLVASVAARSRLETSVLPAITSRVEALGSAILGVRYVEARDDTIATALLDLCHGGAQVLIVAGETSIMDQDDVTPCGIRRAGGRVEHYGAPVEPGNQVLLGYLEAGLPVPVIGAPGCVRSRSTNVVDLLLPRLIAGEYLTKRDIVALGHGGLLD